MGLISASFQRGLRAGGHEHQAVGQPCGDSELAFLESLLCAGCFVSLTEQGEETGQRW